MFRRWMIVVGVLWVLSVTNLAAHVYTGESVDLGAIPVVVTTIVLVVSALGRYVLK